MLNVNKELDIVVNAVTGLDPVTLLSNEVQRVLEKEEPDLPDWGVVRVQIQLNPVDPFLWLNIQRHKRKVYWKGRGASESVAGIGCADEIASEQLPIKDLEGFKQHFLKSRHAKYFGGIRFDPRQAPSKEWVSFGGCRFILPRFELITTEESARLVCNLVLPRDKKRKWHILKEISEIKLSPHDLTGEMGLPITRLDEPREEEWNHIINHILDKLDRESSLEKVVIARKVTFNYGDEIDPLILFKKLTLSTPTHFHFYFQFGPESVFMGASPERLYKRDGQYIESEAVAGTGRRSENGKDDSRFADALLSSEKDQREHAFVRDGILRSMEDLCSKMQIDSKPSILNLNMGRHLRSKFWGILHSKSTDVDILQQLHPTSAVGGHPTEQALDTIQELEPFDRGWYAGPVGWIGQNSAEFSVAIRSALASKESVSLFSGAGIVKGSIPQNEWLEVEQKNSDFIKVLGLDQRSIKY